MLSGHVDDLARGEDAAGAGGRVGEEGQVLAGVRGEVGREVEQEAGGHLRCFHSAMAVLYQGERRQEEEEERVVFVKPGHRRGS